MSLETSLNEVIDFKNELDERYYYRKGKQPFYDILESEMIDTNSIYQWRRKYVRSNKSGVVPTLTANMGTGGHNVPLIKTKFGIRKLTPRETFNVQGFPKIINYQIIYHMGNFISKRNSVVVPVIKRIALNIASALEQDTIDNQFAINGFIV